LKLSSNRTINLLSSMNGWIKAWAGKTDKNLRKI
jgi:hypothetical protein